MEYNNHRRHPTRSMLICIFKMNTQQKGSKTVRPAQELAQKITMMRIFRVSGNTFPNPLFWLVFPWFPHGFPFPGASPHQDSDLHEVLNTQTGEAR